MATIAGGVSFAWANASGTTRPAPTCAGCTITGNVGNSWGNLIASLPTYFAVTAPTTVYPGDTITVILRMYDAYDQNIISAPGESL